MLFVHLYVICCRIQYQEAESAQRAQTVQTAQTVQMAQRAQNAGINTKDVLRKLFVLLNKDNGEIVQSQYE
jgi:hypothetical protein